MVDVYKLDNGLSVVLEEMDAAQSASLSMLLPFGAAHDPRGFEGQASVVSEMFSKGAGSWDAKALSQEFEDAGIERSVSTGVEATIFSMSMLPEKIFRAIELLGIVLMSPTFPEGELGSVTDLALQDLLALEDNPAAKVMVELSDLYYPYPWGASQIGTVEGIRSITVSSIREFYKNFILPSDAVIGIAGRFDRGKVEESINRAFSFWKGERARLPHPCFPTESKRRHIDRSTSQCHIGIAYPSVSVDHPCYYSAMLAVNVLSGGMFGRLFVEVREKRGLVYSVSASHTSAKGRGAIVVHAGTTPERVRETLDVVCRELDSLSCNLSNDELYRASVDLKSRVVMRGEIPSARSLAIASDLWNLGRVRSLAEVKRNIENTSLDEIVNYSKEYPIRFMSLVSLGSVDLCNL